MKYLSIFLFLNLVFSLGISAQEFSFNRVETSELIIEGKIINQEVIYNNTKTRLYTINTVQISKLFKGDNYESEIQIVTLGGTKDNFSYTAFHTESLYYGQEGIFFLKKISPERKATIGYRSSNDFFLAGNYLSITYTTSTKYPAKDKLKSYTSLQDVYQEIQSYTVLPPISIRPNTWEQKEEENYILLSKNGNSVIEYRFQKILYDYPYLNIDISVLSNLTDIYYAGGEFLLKYDSEALGEYLINNQKMEIKHSPLLNELTYPITYADINKHTAKAEIKLNSLSNLFPLSSFEHNIFSIKIDISNLVGIGSISMDDLQMSGKSYYYKKGSKGIETFDEIKVPSEIPIRAGCFSYFPDELNAGVGDILTITPDDNLNFGTIQGNVWVGNANKDNTTIALDPHHILSWSPNEIVVTIPHITDPGGTPGSGDIEVDYYDTNSKIQTVKSKKPLHICYSVMNRACQGIIQDELIDVYDNNTTGGYTFKLGSQLDAIPMAREIIEDAICKWNDATGINFTLSDIVIPNPSPNPDPTQPPIPLSAQADGQNIIFLGGVNEGLISDPQTGIPSTANAFQGTTSYDPNLDGCAEKRWRTDTDIIFNKDLDFYLSLNNNEEIPSGKLDFSSVIMHELGHAHSHGHANHPWTGLQTDQRKTMYYALLEGWNRRYIDACAALGSEYIFEHSQELGVVSPMTMGSCVTNSIENIDNTKSALFNISPNPFHTSFNIEFMEQPSNQFVEIELYNTKGQLVWKEKKYSANEIFTYTSKTNISNGIYLMLLKFDEKIYSSKLMKAE